MREFDTETLQMLRVFEDITGAQVRDCILDKTNSSVVFIVFPGQMGLAIGKNGMNIKMAEKLLGKHIKVFEYSEDVKQFVKNLIPFAKRIEIKNDKIIVWAEPQKKGKIIGKGGSNIKLIRKIIERNCKIKQIEVR
ncbi:MAG TPA: NusA-like transcription termination signal-binding factor [Nanoarchaeota archaeon]|nr:NusA-like transcription termination signal-binding factor [Nanoarchaeota archaeon]